LSIFFFFFFYFLFFFFFLIFICFGYIQGFVYIDGKITWQEMLVSVLKETKLYAKRQKNIL
jgi:tRNA A37 N6-isopentenylltransferase MiaA